ncbi:MAG: hypothetical protein IPO29_11755 [Anaerolineae bacterium]|nr:hypothetical protein [Anaerolineae bacterium]
MAEIPEPKTAADTVPLDQEAKDLKLAQTKAEARKGIAEAEAATLKAQLPAVTATGLEGTIEAKDKFGTLAEVVGYAALGDAAAEIARRVNDAIKGPGSPRVLLVEQTDIASTDAVLLQIKPVLDWHEADISARIGALETLGKPREAPADDSDTLREMLSITSALAVGGAVIGAVSQIASLIRTNYVATGREFKADNLALMAEVARRLKELQVSAVIEGFDLITASPLFARFAALQKQRAHLDAQRRRVNEVVIAPAVATTTDLAKRIGDTELEVARRKDDGKPAGELEKQIKTWKGAQAELALRLEVARTAVAQADATAAAWDTLAKDLTTACRHRWTHAVASGRAARGDSRGQDHSPVVSQDGLERRGCHHRAALAALGAAEFHRLCNGRIPAVRRGRGRRASGLRHGQRREPAGLQPWGWRHRWHWPNQPDT